MNREDRIINRIEEILKSYEEEYKPGAWEEFALENRKRKRIILWQRWAAAVAVLLLVTYASVEYVNTGRAVKYHRSVKLKTKSANKDPLMDKRQSDLDNDRHDPPHKQNTYPVARVNDPTSTQTVAAIADTGALVFDTHKSDTAKQGAFHIAQANRNTETDTLKPKALVRPDLNIQKTRAESKALAKASGSSLFENVPAPNERSEKKKDSKNLVYSIVFSPAIGNQKFNLGSGFEVAYRLAPNVSLSGGIMYSSIQGGKNNNEMVQGSKKLQNVAVAISGFEIPVGIQYQTKGGIFFTAGVSAMTVTSQKVDYTYLSQVTETVTIVSGGMPQEIVRVVTQETTEQDSKRTANYIGFYSFSGGTKIKLGDKAVTVGPFVRVPFGLVSSEKIKLVQGGLRIHWDF